jgi:hypothetical protein
MSTPVEAQPKRRSGRPSSSEPLSPVAEIVAETVPRIPNDERVGLSVPDPGCTGITFEDGKSYRVENGMIVERVA